jgi:hypothetical protein
MIDQAGHRQIIAFDYWVWPNFSLGTLPRTGVDLALEFRPVGRLTFPYRIMEELPSTGHNGRTSQRPVDACVGYGGE